MYWASPETTVATRCAGSETNFQVILSRYGLSFSQYPGLRTTVSLTPDCIESNLNGPAPTGLVYGVPIAGSVHASAMNASCSATRSANVAPGLLSVATSGVGLATFVEIPDAKSCATAPLPGAANRSQFALTAAASNGLPFVNFRPGRSFNVQTVKLAFGFRLVARPGWI